MESEKTVASRRVGRLVAHLRVDDVPAYAGVLGIERVLTGAGKAAVRIGDVSMDLVPPPEGLETLVPVGYLDPAGEPQDVLRILRFMMQKDTLGQDVYLIGPPGPLRRNIVFKYCELVQRPVEYVSLSQDTTESDLKQRREINNGTARYVDCAAVRAAKAGSMLVLDGIEKAERNVMPLLNNLLENREMNCEDSTFLVSPKRYDALVAEHTPQEMAQWKLIRTSDRFRVIALGVPIPRYPGSALDPPFRSRFQARDVPSLRPTQQLEEIELRATESSDPLVVRQIIQASAVLSDLRHSEGGAASTAVPEFPQGYESTVGILLEYFPHLSPRALADFVYPFPALLEGSTDERGNMIDKVLYRFALNRRAVFVPGLVKSDLVIANGNESSQSGGTPNPPDAEDALASSVMCEYSVSEVTAFGTSHQARVRFRLEPLNRYSHEYLHSMKENDTIVTVSAGTLAPATSVPGMVETRTNMAQFSRMVQAHAVGDFCLLGEKGGGKSALVHYFARRLGYEVEHIPLYKDITARGLLQRRTTRPNGDTDWEDSSLVVAALTGRIAILDGVEQMIPGTLASLQLLVSDREARLPNGVRLISAERFEMLQDEHGLSRAELEAQGVLPIHPAFRIIALARPTGVKGGGSPTGTWRDWLGSEVQSMFSFVFVDPVEPEEQKFILRTLAPRVPVTELDHLMGFAKTLRKAVASDEMLTPLLTAVSLRSMIRICRRIAVDVQQHGDGDASAALHDAVLRASLSRFLPPIVLETLLAQLKAAAILPTKGAGGDLDHLLSIEVVEGDRAQALRKDARAVGVLKIGNVTVDILPPKDPLLIPDILFYDNPRQALSMREMVKDWTSGQHLLLIGNQGVGKNKLADRMLQLLRLPREYIQLHRDTTVQNLTSNPTIVDGVLQYEDSPLVRAAREGRVLVVDEADKAPTHVTAILKALVEDRSMLLADGRRILDPEDVVPGTEDRVIPLHPEFRLIALANRPGFPFHGNDFFREVGDVFSCHAIDNPDANSEMYLLKQYGPDVPEDTLRKLIAAFDELRGMSDEGQLSYPYSTRELTAVVKHMQRFPNDGVDRILRNVFDFDNYSHEEKTLLVEVFAKHGVPFSIGASSFHVSTGRTRTLPPPKLIEQWSVANTSSGDGMRSASHDLIKLNAFVSPTSEIIRMNLSKKSEDWPLKPAYMETTLARNERSSVVFTEELYSFALPQGLILGVTTLADGTIVALARSHSFMMYVIDPAQQHCSVHDLHSSTPADGVYRIAPTAANVFALGGEGRRVLVQNPQNGNMLVVDLDTLSFRFVDLPPGAARKGPKVQIVQCPAPHQTRFLMYQCGHRFLTVMDFAQDGETFSTTVSNVDPPRQQLLLGVDRVDALTGNAWLLTSTENKSERQTTFRVYLDETEGRFLLDRLNRQEPAPEYAKTATMPTFASPTPMSSSPGALKPGAARMIQLREPGGEPGERIPAFAVDLPGAFASGSRANIFQIDEKLVVGDSGTQAEEDAAPKEGEDAKSKRKVARVHAQQLSESNLMAVVRESPERMIVDVELYDVNSSSRRTLSVNLEDDAITKNQNDPDARQRVGSGAKKDPRYGTEVRHSPNLASLKQTLSPSQLNMFAMRRTSIAEASQRLFLTELSATTILTVDCLGTARVWLVDELAIRQAFADWRKLVGRAEDEPLKLLFENDDERKKKYGIADEDDGDGDGEGEGEGQGKGKGKGKGKGSGDGEGDGDGDGGGGGSGDGGGPGQLSSGGGGGSMSGQARGKTLDQLGDLPDPSDEEFQQIENPGAAEMREAQTDEIASSVKRETEEFKREEWLQFLQKLDMSEHDAEKYDKYKEAVKTEVRELRVTLEGLEANDTERIWLKNQVTGDIDDSKLIDGLTGERAIYKRRSDLSPDSALFQAKPKRISFVFDASMSMTRYAADGRLQRSLEATTMILEAVKGMEHRFDIAMSAHSGDTAHLPLVDFGKPPRTDKERLNVVRQIYAHAEMCESGDNTVNGLRRAIEAITRGPDADARYVVLVSDANVDMYGITPETLDKLIKMDPRVHVFVLFIASMSDQSKVFEEKLPGRVFTCLDTSEVPKNLKKMFLAAATTAKI
ncbi:von Willebrand factor A domain-containing protein 8 [Hondaea fermentalgiana]|uniref:von Willebrand factor A domain-containing protein 8 n=1 Tax=Hondaea fermentalgiana TaxID=2315210 RepID=A0A2R5GCM4_9STRA|nr:von Willebrand factor A domain-containing protein 8 [Hondaea fermentalgiana]|eukprot:GBG25911.1 von Willebrand factor A domain-containing protein 8 [Hondaea fermentalgiana]